MQVVIPLNIPLVEFVPNMSRWKVFNMTKERNEPRPLAKHISCECRCEFDGRKCNSR